MGWEWRSMCCCSGLTPLAQAVMCAARIDSTHPPIRPRTHLIILGQHADQPLHLPREMSDPHPLDVHDAKRLVDLAASDARADREDELAGALVLLVHCVGGVGGQGVGVGVGGRGGPAVSASKFRPAKAHLYVKLDHALLGGDLTQRADVNLTQQLDVDGTALWCCVGEGSHGCVGLSVCACVNVCVCISASVGTPAAVAADKKSMSCRLLLLLGPSA